MKSTDTTPAYQTEEIGTPKDYTDDRYKFYFEVRDFNNVVKNILTNYSHEVIKELSHGYEAILNIQMVPDIVKEILSHNIAIYQVVRYAKLA